MKIKRVSQSEVKAFRRCRRKWWLGYVRRLNLVTITPGARDIGTYVHSALETHYDPSDSRDPFARIAELRDKDLARVDDLKTDDVRSNAELATIMVEGYFDWLEESGEDEHLEVISLEQELETPLVQLSNELVVHLIGKLDQRVRNRIDGSISFLDHKTVGNFTDIPKMAPRDEQFLTYELLHRRVFPDERTDGGVWNMLRKVKRTARSTPPYYKRWAVRFNEHQLNAMWARLQALATEMIETEQRVLADPEEHQRIVPPTPTKDCSWDCDYAHVCPMFDDGSRVEDALTSLYVTGDPYARYKEKEQNSG